MNLNILKFQTQAASTSVYCAAALELDGVGGMYFNNCCRCQPSTASEDEALAKILWDISENMIARIKECKSDVNEICEQYKKIICEKYTRRFFV